MIPKYIEISGVLEVDVSNDEFVDEFIDWIESKGWYYTGGTKEVDENGEDI